MTPLLALPVAVPLTGAALALALRGRPTAQRVLTLAASSTVLGVGGWLVRATADGDVLVARIGGWPADLAITYAVDPLSALMLTVGGLMATVCTVFAILRGEDAAHLHHPLVLVLVAGISASFLTADLFHLFVAFEVMLIASYVLVAATGTRDAVRGGIVYVAVNLLGSTLLLIGIALVYGAAGTVNLAELHRVGASSGQVLVGGAIVLTAFAVKASLVPLHGWVPVAYTVAPPAAAALFSGMLTKVGVYALYRTTTLVFDGVEGIGTPLLIIASATMVVGVLGAVGRGTLREILSFHITSQVGYMILGLGLLTPFGLAAGIFYVLHHIVVKTSLFLTAGAVESVEGTGSLDRLAGLARRRPVLSTGFAVAAFSLAGLPPLSGFVAKLGLIRAAFEDAEPVAAAIAVAVGFLTLLSMLKIWNGAFWEEPDPHAEAEAAEPAIAGGSEDADERGGRGRLLAVPALLLAAVTVALGLWPQELLALTERAAEMLLDPSAYVEAVLER